jgi:hypothetical protein
MKVSFILTKNKVFLRKSSSDDIFRPSQKVAKNPKRKWNFISLFYGIPKKKWIPFLSPME